MQLGGFLFGQHNLFGPPITSGKTSLANPIINSFEKELKNTGTKTLNIDILVDTWLNIIDKKIKNGISSITVSWITLTNNEMKYIIKVIESLENFIELKK